MDGDGYVFHELEAVDGEGVGVTVPLRRALADELASAGVQRRLPGAGGMDVLSCRRV
jgi:hypothetical protein